MRILNYYFRILNQLFPTATHDSIIQMAMKEPLTVSSLMPLRKTGQRPRCYFKPGEATVSALLGAIASGAIGMVLTNKKHGD